LRRAHRRSRVQQHLSMECGQHMLFVVSCLVFSDGPCSSSSSVSCCLRLCVALPEWRWAQRGAVHGGRRDGKATKRTTKRGKRNHTNRPEETAQRKETETRNEGEERRAEETEGGGDGGRRRRRRQGRRRRRAEEAEGGGGRQKTRGAWLRATGREQMAAPHSVRCCTRNRMSHLGE
jgi:hypothetical protein